MRAGWGSAVAGDESGGGLVEEERADAELEQEELARGRGRVGGGGGRCGGEEGVPGGRGREVLREGGVRAVAEPRAPRAARLQAPGQLVAAPVLAQQLRRRHRPAPRRDLPVVELLAGVGRRLARPEAGETKGAWPGNSRPGPSEIGRAHV